MMKRYWVFNLDSGKEKVVTASTPEKALLKAAPSWTGGFYFKGAYTVALDSKNGTWSVFHDAEKNRNALRQYDRRQSLNKRRMNPTKATHRRKVAPRGK